MIGKVVRLRDSNRLDIILRIDDIEDYGYGDTNYRTTLIKKIYVEPGYEHITFSCVDVNYLDSKSEVLEGVYQILYGGK